MPNYQSNRHNRTHLKKRKKKEQAFFVQDLVPNEVHIFNVICLLVLHFKYKIKTNIDELKSICIYFSTTTIYTLRNTLYKIENIIIN